MEVELKYRVIDPATGERLLRRALDRRLPGHRAGPAGRHGRPLPRHRRRRLRPRPDRGPAADHRRRPAPHHQGRDDDGRRAPPPGGARGPGRRWARPAELAGIGRPVAPPRACRRRPVARSRRAPPGAALPDPARRRRGRGGAGPRRRRGGGRRASAGLVPGARARAQGRRSRRGWLRCSTPWRPRRGSSRSRPRSSSGRWPRSPPTSTPGPRRPPPPSGRSRPRRRRPPRRGAGRGRGAAALVVGKTPGVTATDTIAEAGRRVFRFHLARMLAREAGTRSGKDPEDLHDMRVATRRMRAAWRVFGDGYRANRTRRLRGRLRTLAGRLGAVRDLDVLIGAAEGYRDGLPAEAAERIRAAARRLAGAARRGPGGPARGAGLGRLPAPGRRVPGVRPDRGRGGRRTAEPDDTAPGAGHGRLADVGRLRAGPGLRAGPALGRPRDAPPAPDRRQVAALHPRVLPRGAGARGRGAHPAGRRHPGSPRLAPRRRGERRR